MFSFGNVFLQFQRIPPTQVLTIKGQTTRIPMFLEKSHAYINCHLHRRGKYVILTIVNLRLPTRPASTASPINAAGELLMDDVRSNGILCCTSGKFPVELSFPETPIADLLPESRNAYPSINNPDDMNYHGTAIVSPKKGTNQLPSDSDLTRPDVIIFVEFLPYRGQCSSGSWRLPVRVTNIEHSEQPVAISFDFIQEGSVGPMKKLDSTQGGTPSAS